MGLMYCEMEWGDSSKNPKVDTVVLEETVRIGGVFNIEVKHEVRIVNSIVKRRCQIFFFLFRHQR